MIFCVATVRRGDTDALSFLERIQCPRCWRVYKHKSSLYKHLKWECGQESQFRCDLCSYICKQKGHLQGHMRRKHSLQPLVDQ
ncbi:hypothetical protein Zmor_008097 [Zophobas morio]|uniref:C2H2-type domain-containing protein n=1 Tax=Zophobas morio TaxID=2755281 RepID=A0AA38MQ24_9CUCU|nr:hypothetical protein Zmor_008097 [Zophobas morio]